MIIKSAIPSIPKAALELARTSQLISQNNWKLDDVESKTNKSKIEKLKTSKDQNNAKLRWNQRFVLSTNNKTTTAKKGNEIRSNNIKNKIINFTLKRDLNSYNSSLQLDALRYAI